MIHLLNFSDSDVDLCLSEFGEIHKNILEKRVFHQTQPNATFN